MKSILQTTETLINESHLIDYENGISCTAMIVNGKLIDYNFKSDKLRLNYVGEFLNEIKNSHWSDHHKILQKVKQFKTLKGLEFFTDFDNLLYLGMSRDGITKDRFGNFISTVTILNESFSSIYLDIETTEKECQEILDSLKREFIIKSGIVSIPYYNINESKSSHYTISLQVRIPDKEYNEIYSKKRGVFREDDKNVEIFNFLKK